MSTQPEFLKNMTGNAVTNALYLDSLWDILILSAKCKQNIPVLMHKIHASVVSRIPDFKTLNLDINVNSSRGILCNWYP